MKYTMGDLTNSDRSGSHKVPKGANKQQGEIGDCNGDLMKPLVLDSGTWEGAEKVPLEEEVSSFRCILNHTILIRSITLVYPAALLVDALTHGTPCCLALFVQHYLPMQPVASAKWQPTLHRTEQLFTYLAEQSAREEEWQPQVNESNSGRPERTV